MSKPSTRGSKGGDQAVSILSVSKQFDRPILRDVSISVSDGELVGLVGPNGGGKTTLLRILLGLQTADRGNASLWGQPYRQLSNPARKVGVALDGPIVAPSKTGRQHLKQTARLIGVSVTVIDSLLEEVKLSEAADQPVGAYSLGMSKRLALATALLGEPKLLVLDEPFNGLDPFAVRWLTGLLESKVAAGGTVLITSHHLHELEVLASRIVILSESIRYDGPPVDPDSELSLEDTFFAYMEVPA